jgi:ketosteroid isomerase-like protein
VLAATVALGAAASISGQTLSAEDSLKATHETLMKAVAAANAERVSALIHPRALGFFRMSQQVAELQGGSSLQVLVETLLRDLGEFTASQQSLTTRLRVVGDTGIVTQTLMREAVVDGRKVVRYLRTTAVYVRSPDGWRLMSWHTSDAPLKK